MNRGRRLDFRFYRDTAGNEVDVLFQVGNQWIPVEIKSGKTINPDYFRGIAEFAGVMGDEAGTIALMWE